MEPGTTPAMLFGKLKHMEETHSLKDIKDMARKAGVSPTGTKRDILLKVLEKKASTWQEPVTAPMTVRGYSRRPRRQWAEQEGRRWRN